MTFEQIKSSVKSNLDDVGVFFSEADLTESLEDAHSEILFLSKCRVKKLTLDFIARPYYDFKILGVEDFIACMAVYNNNTNRWLFDDLTVRDFDDIRQDWELWTGTPQNWAPVNLDLVAIVPYMSPAEGNFDLYYVAKAPTLTDTSESPLLATDAQKLLEFYCTADLLEQAEEFTKASTYWKEYFEGLMEYSDRVRNLARRDLLLKI